MTETTFPLDSFKDAAIHLRRPFTPAAVKFKVQATFPKQNPTGGMIVGYIDARLVVERLNLIVPHLWYDEYQADGKNLICRLTVDGISRRDVGEGVGKALYSDALKRAAVKFGVGVSLYAIPQTFLKVTDGHLKPNRDSLLLTPSGEERARNFYAKWLKDHGVKAFGEPLDHGDAEGSQGDAEVDVPETSDAEPTGGAGSGTPQARTPAPPKAAEPVATEAQRSHISGLSDELGLSSTDLADAICAAAGTPTREFKTLDEAYAWCDRALGRLPARLVADVEGRLRKMAGMEVAA